MLTAEEIAALIRVVDAGVKSLGVQLFQNGGGLQMQGVVQKLQVMLDEANKPPQPKEPEAS